jgi:hypothetical protein
MQPILAESVPHRRRAIAVVAGLAIMGALLLIPHRAHPRSRQHHKPHCVCNHASYVVVVR